MRITEQNKRELQQLIEKELEKVPFGKRISLDSELLEALLFEKIVIDEETGLTVKFPFWSGEFLRKLDLSKISFEDVSFGFPYIPKNAIRDDMMIRLELATINFYDGETIVDYSHTNANIDLSKLFGARFGVVTLSECNLKGIDLKNQDLSNIEIVYIVQSDVSNTGLFIPSDVVLQAYESNLSNINLSNREIDGNLYISQDTFPYGALADCCLLNTGISIEFDENKYINTHEKKFKQYRDCYEKKDMMWYILKELYEDHEKRYENAFSKNWIGCFVNGEKIKLNNYIEEEYPINKVSDEEKQELFSSVVNSIEQQLNGYKTKIKSYDKKNNQD